jgi:hypothetical protein
MRYLFSVLLAGIVVAVVISLLAAIVARPDSISALPRIATSVLDSIAAKFLSSSNDARWVCPSLLTLAEGKVPRMFAVVNGNVRSINKGRGYEWSSARIYAPASRKRGTLTGALVCTYQPVGHRGRELERPDPDSLTLKTRSGYIAKVWQSWFNDRWQAHLQLIDHSDGRVESVSFYACSQSPKDCRFSLQKPSAR